MSFFQNQKLAQLINGTDNLALIFPTGTGKTLTAAIAAVCSVDENKCQPQVLYLCATLESAIQIHTTLCRIAAFTSIKIGLIAKTENGLYRFSMTNIVCGVTYTHFNKPSMYISAYLGKKLNDHIVAGTPKEVASFSLMRIIDIEKLSLCIIDDADETYTTDVVKSCIANRLRCRTVMMSATSLKSVLDRDYASVCTTISSSTKSFFIKTEVTDKLQCIMNVYKMLMDSNAKAIIFCNVSNIGHWHFIYVFIKRPLAFHCFSYYLQTRHSLDILHNILTLKRLNIITVSAKCSADERRKLFHEFENGKTPLAICSDVYARGINVPSVKIVINFEVPFHSVRKTFDTKTFVYRKGRTSRFGLLLSY